MPTVTRHEQNLVSTRTLTLPNSFEIEVCLTTDSVLENGGKDSELLAAATIHSGGIDSILQSNAEIQNAN